MRPPQKKDDFRPPGRWAIDGYNVLFAVRVEGPDAEDFEKQRGILLDKVRRLKEPVTVFFDAAKAPPSLTNEPEGRGKLEIVYVRNGSADDAIVEWLKTQPRPDQVRVVTNDRELAARVKALHARVSPVVDFVKRADPERLEGAEKPKIGKDEAREWAKEFGVDPDAMV